MHRRLVVVLAFVSLAFGSFAAAPSATSARCAASGLVVVVLTPPSVTVPRDAAFLVGLESEATRAARGRDLPASVVLSLGERRIAARLETIAPGLARAVPESAPDAGRWTVGGEGVRAGQAVTFGDAALPPPPDAPRVRQVVVRQTAEASRRSRAQYSVVATLARPVARAVVIAAVSASGTGSWMRVTTPRATEVQLHPRVGRCQRQPPRFGPVPAGREARVVVVDAFGRTAEATVTPRS